jgi:hypothetical protein
MSPSVLPTKETTMQRRIAAVGAALLLVLACTDVPTQPPEAVREVVPPNEDAIILEGTPGRYVVDFAVMNMMTGLCRAEYEVGNGQNTAITNRGKEPDFHVAMNKNWVNATCKFPDLSGAYDDNAEVGEIQFCRLILENGTVFNGGTGTVTSAANIEDEPYDPYSWGAGGNTMIRCKFANEPELLRIPVLLSPENGSEFYHFPRTTTLVWSEDPNAAEYEVQTRYLDPTLGWQPYVGGIVVDPSFTFEFVGKQRGSWRVRAIAEDGTIGPWSLWWYFEYFI